MLGMNGCVLAHPLSCLCVQLYSANATVCVPTDETLLPGVHRFRFGFTLPTDFIPSVDIPRYAGRNGPSKPKYHATCQRYY